MFTQQCKCENVFVILFSRFISINDFICWIHLCHLQLSKSFVKEFFAIAILKHIQIEDKKMLSHKCFLFLQTSHKKVCILRQT